MKTVVVLTLFLLTLSATGQVIVGDIEPITIHDVQHELRERGYYYGAANGTLNKRTTKALMNFQKDKGLQVTGEINEQTLAALGITQAEEPPVGAIGGPFP